VGQRLSDFFRCAHRFEAPLLLRPQPPRPLPGVSRVGQGSEVASCTLNPLSEHRHMEVWRPRESPRLFQYVQYRTQVDFRATLSSTAPRFDFRATLRAGLPTTGYVASTRSPASPHLHDHAAAAPNVASCCVRTTKPTMPASQSQPHETNNAKPSQSQPKQCQAKPEPATRNQQCQAKPEPASTHPG